MVRHSQSSEHSPHPSPELQDRLYQHLQQLARERDPYLARGGHHWVQTYIRSTWEAWGTVVAHQFQVRGQLHTNWVLKLPPRSPAAVDNPPILVGAHYDAVPGTPGADDNASGVAVLLEVAHYVAQYASVNPLWCVAFDMEEYGLLGSQAYAAALKASGQPLRLMISLEMLGYCDRTAHSQHYPAPWLTHLYPHTGDFIGLLGTLPTLPDLLHLKHHLRRAGAACQWLPIPAGGRWLPASRLSDQASFWDQGYRGIMVTDTAFLRNPHYHRHSDRLETLDLDFMTRVCQGLMTGLTTLS